MTKYVTFLRAINVGGRNIIKMETLRGMFESMGFTNVETYIQSGNVIFESRRKNITSLRSKIETHLKNSLGYEVGVSIVSAADLAAMVEEEPFKRVEADQDVMLFVTFLSSEPPAAPKLPLTSEKENVEVIALQGRAAFIVSRRKKNGMFGFPNNFIEKQLGVSGTTRNWTTVKKLMDRIH